MLSMESTKKGSAKKKRDAGRKKKNAIKAKPEISTTVQTKKAEDGDKVTDDQRKVKASLSDKPAKEAPATKAE